MTSTTPSPSTSPSTDADTPAPAPNSVLDNLAWHALTTVHAHLAEGDGPVRRYRPEVAGFVAIESQTPRSWQALADLVGPSEEVILAGGGGILPPDGWKRLGGGFGLQMVLAGIACAPVADVAIAQLTRAHVPQMLDLVELTRPGPFRRGTIELGSYYGIFTDGLLVAMAGERLQTPEYTEISAVCTHPRARGLGYASTLSRHVVNGILARNKVPILHVAESNVNARAVYERLGFVVRQRLEFVALRTPTISDRRIGT